MLRRAVVVWSLLALAGLSPLASGFAQPAAPAATPHVRQGATPVAAQPLPLAEKQRVEFAAFVAVSLAKLGVPGAAVAVVQDGQVVFLEGYGVREAGKPARVTPDTLMEIGSITKPLTSLMAATLVDDGLLSWDTPVVDLLPTFAVADPALTRRLTLDDLLCHCSGLPNRDETVFWNADRLDPAGLISSLAETKATAAPGERLQYSNQLYSVAGYAAAAAAGAAPDDLLAGYRLAMRERVLGPIGMKRSTFDTAEVLASGDYALPHAADLDGRATTLSLLRQQRLLSAVDPAAGLWSSGREVAAFLETLLTGGVAPDGTPVVSQARLEEVWARRVTFPKDLSAVLGAEGYGLGWFTGEERGMRVLSHSGSTPGFVSELALLPEANLGLAVLTNGGPGAATFAFAVRHRLSEILLEEPVEAASDVATGAAAAKASLAGLRALLGALDPAAVTPYVGRYTNPTLGEVRLTLEDGRLIFDAGEIRSTLRPLRTRPNPDVHYVFSDPGALGSGTQVILRHDAAGRSELVLGTPAILADPALSADGFSPYVFTRSDEPVATPASIPEPSEATPTA